MVILKREVKGVSFRHAFIRIKQFLFLIFLCYSSSVFSSPRLWKIESPNDGIITTHYLLAASHLGLNTEYDDYFYNQVIAAYNSSSSISYEGAGGGEDEPFPQCNSLELSSEGKKIFKNLQKIVARRFREVRYKVSDIGDRQLFSPASERLITEAYVKSLDEFSLLQLNQSLMPSLLSSDTAEKFQTQLGMPSKIKRRNLQHPPVVQTLIKINPKIKVYDIDTKYGIRRAYCSAGEKRIYFLRSLIAGTGNNNVNLDAAISTANEEFNNYVESYGRSKFSSMFVAPLENEIICNRNSEWVRKILSIRDGKTHFYVIGASHFFDYVKSTGTCNGLLNLIKMNHLHAEIIK